MSSMCAYNNTKKRDQHNARLYIAHNDLEVVWQRPCGKCVDLFMSEIRKFPQIYTTCVCCLALPSIWVCVCVCCCTETDEHKLTDGWGRAIFAI